MKDLFKFTTTRPGAGFVLVSGTKTTLMWLVK